MSPVASNGGSVWDRGENDGGDVAGGEASELREPVTPPLAAPPPSARPVPGPMPTPAAPAPIRRPDASRRTRRLALALVALVLVVAGGVLAWSLGVFDDDDETTVTTEPPVPTVSVVPTVPSPSVAEATIPPTAPETTAAPETSAAPTTTAAPPTTAPATTAPAPVGPQVAIVGRTAPCRFGNDCLVADFTISGFATPQREFVCEFESGARYTFRFDGRGAESACATVDGTITIEVGGIRSETISR